MKKISVVIFCFIFTYVSCLSVHYLFVKTKFADSWTRQSGRNVVIDAGHGGADAGTVADDGTLEKDINLGIALKLYDFLRVCGINASLTRDGDYLVYNESDDQSQSDLYNRMDYINSIDNSMLVSIHQNHFEDKTQWGMQVWYTANTDDSKYLADTILNISKNFLQPDNERENKVSDSSYYLLYKAQVPSVMVECGFMSNDGENQKLKDDNYQGNLAYTIMLGITDYLTKEK